ncbi:MAG TPA: hypothetical protein VK881_10500 [bacterium]|nr:hypothetical protein [bacterium]
MFEPDIFANQVFPHRSTRLLKIAGGLAMRVILLPVLVLAAFALPGAAEAPPISPTEEHPAADKQVMVAMFDETDSKWKVSELTGPEPPVSLKKFGEQNIWVFYGVKPSTYGKGTLNIKVSRVFKDQSPMQTDYSFQYETTELGSWIPFYIGTGGSYSSLLQQVTIVITDVGANGPGAEVKRVLVKSE